MKLKRFNENFEKGNKLDDLFNRNDWKTIRELVGNDDKHYDDDVYMTDKGVFILGLDAEELDGFLELVEDETNGGYIIYSAYIKRQNNAYPDEFGYLLSKDNKPLILSSIPGDNRGAKIKRGWFIVKGHDGSAVSENAFDINDKFVIFLSNDIYKPPPKEEKPQFENIEWEDWDEEDELYKKEDYWIVEKMGDDMIYFTKKVKVPLKQKYGGKQFYEIKYQVLEKDHKGNYGFTNRYLIDGMNSAIPLTTRKIQSIFNDKLDVCYIGLINRIIPEKFTSICNILNVDKDSVNFLRRSNR